MSEQEFDKLQQRTRAVFDESVESLDGATRSRLTQARHAALAELKQRPAWFAGWVPAGAMAAAAVLAVTLWVGGESPQVGAPVMASVIEDLELVSAEEDWDMLGEEMEFYAWAVDEVSDGVG